MAEPLWHRNDVTEKNIVGTIQIFGGIDNTSWHLNMKSHLFCEVDGHINLTNKKNPGLSLLPTNMIINSAQISFKG